MKLKTLPLLLLCCSFSGCSLLEKVMERLEERQSEKQEEKKESEQRNETDQESSRPSKKESSLDLEKTESQKKEESQSYTYSILEKDVTSQGQNMVGVLFKPDRAGPLDLVILCHGLVGNYLSLQKYGEDLARKGYAAYCLEFRGSGYNSEGKRMDMTLESEVDDLEAVLRASRTWGLELDQTFLLGHSQGGLVSAIEAGRNEQIDGIMLLAPAFNIPALIHKLVHSLEQAPDYLDWNWLQVGLPYLKAIWDYDPYQDVDQYSGPVLILQGDADRMVPVETAYELAQHYENETLKIMEGADHTFTNESYPEAFSYILDFLESNQ